VIQTRQPLMEGDDVEATHLRFLLVVPNLQKEVET